MSAAHRRNAPNPSSRRARRGWREAVGFAIAALALAAVSAQSVFAADGSDVVNKLHDVSAIVDRLIGATQGADDPDGDEPFSKEANASSIPFLGGTPGNLVEDLFADLDLTGLEAIAAEDDDDPSDIADAFDDIDGLTGQLSCGEGVPCNDDDHDVVDITAIDLVLDLDGDKADDSSHAFTSLNLPSLGFLPKDAGNLDIDLNWTFKIGFHVTADDITLSTPASAHMLTLEATIKAPTGDPEVNLGALIVKAETKIAPEFHGTLFVDLDAEGNFKFGFADNAYFKAKWHLLTTPESPLTGVEADLNILWELGTVSDAGGVDPANLSITLDPIKIKTSEFVGKGVQDAAAGIRDVIHPVRQATSPMMEPIPGLSEIAGLFSDGEDVTMLRIMGLAKGVDPGSPHVFPYSNFEKAIKRIAMLDDVVSALAGGNDVELGPITLAESGALTPNGQDLPAKALEKLETIVAKCSACKEQLGNLLEKLNGEREPGSQSGFKFDVPVLSDPGSLAGLLLGRDVDLITFDTGFLGYEDDLHTEVARFFIFSVTIDGPVVAGIHLKGGVDTAGIVAAIKSKDGEELAHGVYLQKPDGGKPILELSSRAHLGIATGFKVVGVTLDGGPEPKIKLQIPDSAPGGKLRPAVVKDDFETVGCKLVDGGDAEFAVKVSAKFDYWLDEHEEILAEHTFLTKKDICDDRANEVPVAYEDNGNVVINQPSFDNLPSDEPALIKVYMRHDAVNGDKVVVEGNSGRRVEIPVAGTQGVKIQTVKLEWLNSKRDVVLRVVRNDDIPFEKALKIETGEGDDDISIDSSEFALISVHEGADKVVQAAGGEPDDDGKIVSGGPGDDLLIGSNKREVLQGNEGDDTIQGGGGRDDLRGGSGRDVLTDGSLQGNCFIGGPDADLLISGPGADTLIGDDALSCGGGSNPENDGATGDGEDVIITGGGADFVIAGGAKDLVMLHGKSAFGADNPSWKAGETVYGNGGNDTIVTGNGKDSIHGGPGDDDITSDAAAPQTSGPVGNEDSIWGGLGDDLIRAGDAADLIYGDNGHDACSATFVGQPVETANPGGDDDVHGGAGADRISLEAGDDRAQGNGSDDVICGHAGQDDIWGDSDPDDSNPVPGIGGGTGNDTVFGGTNTDFLYGGPEGDLLMGNDGQDSVYGEDGPDRLIGGSNAAGFADAGDLLAGGPDNDVLVGDNGSISDADPRVVRVFDLFANDATLGGFDTIAGEGGEDRAFGGLSGDRISGGDADDHLEGNNGDDEISGNAGDDDIIGGTSDEALPGAAAGQTPADAPDTGETILSGGAGRDVIIGDNGNITRPGGTDAILGGPARAVALFDRDRTGAALAAVSGPDYIEGNGESDRLYGQGGDDYMKGNDADDFAEGNQGGDRIEGNDGEDDLIGGSSFTVSSGVGDPDGSDQLAGGAGADVLLGDNATITRATTGGGSGFDWDSVANNWLGQVARRSITLLDKATLTVGKHGDDVLSGGAGADVLFGQDGVDRLYGGAGDDYQEGNGAADVLFGDQNAAPTGSPHESGPEQLDGAPGPDGQDDQIGGSSWIKSQAGTGARSGQRDGGDELHGDGNADVQLGDNGRILRLIVGGQYATYQAQTGKATLVRQANPTGSTPTALPARYDVGAAATAAVWGHDTLYGDAGDDVQLAGDGNDILYGGDSDDDQYGELGDDRLFGEAGEDGMVGDRGVITNRLVATPGSTVTLTSPPAISFTPYAAHPLDRRVDLNDDGDGAPLQAPGMTTGGNDYLRGGADHDSMHGAAGNDLMNGDSGGDYLFGADGVDVMWGGKGRECSDPADLVCNNDRGVNDANVDYLFGGRGLKTDPVTGGADILDFRPRPGVDPASWFEATDTRPSDPMAAHQHHQGIDWIYGGWDRDVMQANVADNGPNQGDKLLDWTGAYNLYTHCPSAYGGYNDVRLFSPSLQTFLQQLAFSLGAGKSLADVQAKGTSGYSELALVYNADVKSNSGSAYPGTPGHFDDFSCAP